MTQRKPSPPPRPRNPFAIADIINTAPIPWHKLRTPEKTLERLLGVPVKDLFNPSCPRSWVFAPRGARVPVTAWEAAARAAPSRAVRGKQRKLVRVPARRSRTAKPTIDAPEGLLASRRASTWMRVVGGERVQPTEGDWREAPMPRVSAGAQWHEIKQGALADCYLIASLSAVAWWRPDWLTTQQAEESKGIIVSTYADGFRVTTTNKVPYLEGADVPAYAKDVQGEAEGWPALWEKAYILRLDQKQPRTTPDYTILENQNQHAALLAHAGKDTRLWGWPDEATWTALADACDERGFVRCAAVTDTLNTHPEWFDAYDGMISFNHAYTVLGILPSGAEPLLVLRDPNAVQWAEIPKELQAAMAALKKAPQWAEVRKASGGVCAVPRNLVKRLFATLSMSPIEKANGNVHAD